MSGKATAGFANLRAKFENQESDSPPPSRGRSPAGSVGEVKGGSGRKIRTSFISVERSGHMAPSADQRESLDSNDDQQSVTEGAEAPKTEMNGDGMQVPYTNGTMAAPVASPTPNKPAGEDSGESKPFGASNNILELEQATTAGAINPGKPVAAGEDKTPSMQVSDRKNETTISGGAAALAPKGESLGALLKGSEFEEPDQQDNPKLSSPKKPVLPSNPSTPVKKNGSSQRSTPRQPKAANTPKVNGSPKTKAGSTRSSMITKPQSPASATSHGKPIPSPDKTVNSPKTPVSSTALKNPLPQAPSSTSSPKETTQPKTTDPPSDKDRKKASLPKPSFSAPRKEVLQAMKSQVAKPNPSAKSNEPKRGSPNSPSTVKPQPKPPTRPVRLPGAATASTAASAAKTGSTGPSLPASQAEVNKPPKPTTAGNATGPNGSVKPSYTAPSNVPNKPPRSSLPASITAPKSKPRTSLASTSAPGNSFLARMMRPTQSSASKTHEKVEQKTPPKKRVSSRPKRISDEAQKPQGAKADEVEAPSEHQQELQESLEPNDLKPDTDRDDFAQDPVTEAPDAINDEQSLDGARTQSQDPITAQ
ncbi:MAG: hypothetical protein Q9220_001561 [cf. Caloplaca sp. 1 TL-2023]